MPKPTGAPTSETLLDIPVVTEAVAALGQVGESAAEAARRFGEAMAVGGEMAHNYNGDGDPNYNHQHVQPRQITGTAGNTGYWAPIHEAWPPQGWPPEEWPPQPPQQQLSPEGMQRIREARLRRVQEELQQDFERLLAPEPEARAPEPEPEEPEPAVVPPIFVPGQRAMEIGD